MPISIKCPSCDAAYKLADNMLGKKVVCRQCKEPIIVTSGGTAKRDEPRQPQKPKPSKRPREDEIEEAEEVEGSVMEALAAEAETAEADVDDADVEEAEAVGAESTIQEAEEVDDASDAEEVEEAEDAEDRPAKKKPAKKGLSPVVLIGGVAAVVVVGVVAVLLTRGGDEKKPASSPGSASSTASAPSSLPAAVTAPSSAPVTPSTPWGAPNAPSETPNAPPNDAPPKPPADATPGERARDKTEPKDKAGPRDTEQKSKDEPKVAKAEPRKRKKNDNEKIVDRMSEGEIYDQVVKSTVWVLGERSKFRLIIPKSQLLTVRRAPGDDEAGDPNAPPGDDVPPPPPDEKPRRGGKKPGKKPVDDDDDDDDDRPLLTIKLSPPLSYSGSGALISQKHKLILTNVHVAGDADKLIFHFPDFDGNGKPIRERGHYETKPGIPGKVVARLDRADLALVQLESLPADIPPLPIARKSAAPGQLVHAIGNPGASARLFNTSPGVVRQVSRDKWVTGIPLPIKLPHLMFLDCWILESTNTTNQGNSGGPLVDDWGRLVGVCQGHSTRAAKMRRFVDIREVHTILERYCKKAGLTWTPETPDIVPREVAEIPELQQQLKPGHPLPTRVQAIRKLTALGNDASEAFADVFHLLNDPDSPEVRREAWKAVKAIPPEKEHIDLMCSALKDKTRDVEIRVIVAKFLGQLKQDGKPAADTLVEQLPNAEPELKKQMLMSLLAIRPDPKHVPALAETLKANDPEVSRLAGDNLIKLGPKAKAALPALIKALKSDQRTTRVVAANVIHAVGADAAEAKPDLLLALRDSEREVVIAAARALIGLGETKKMVPMLTDAIKNGDGDLRKRACKGLAALGPKVKDKAAVEELIAALDDVNVRKDAAAALVKIGRFSVDIIAAKILITPRQPLSSVINKDSRRECILVLDKIGQITAAADTALRGLQGFDPDEGNKKLAKRVRKKLTGDKGVG